MDYYRRHGAQATAGTITETGLPLRRLRLRKKDRKERNEREEVGAGLGSADKSVCLAFAQISGFGLQNCIKQLWSTPTPHPVISGLVGWRQEDHQEFKVTLTTM